MIRTIIIFFAFACIAQAEDQIEISFDDQTAEKQPAGFTFALTGKGNDGKWVILKDETAPSKPNVLAQTDRDETANRFPLAVFDGFQAKDVEISVKFKLVEGDVDQAAGMVFRYKDKDNYYLAMVNVIDNEYKLYKVVNGKRKKLAESEEIKIKTNKWYTIKIKCADTEICCLLNNEMLICMDDDTFKEAGKIGLCTKADSVIYFDDLEMTDLTKVKEIEPPKARHRGYLGINPMELNQDERKGYDLDEDEGVKIVKVIPDTPAEKAKLEAGDIILKVDKEKITDPAQLARIIQGKGEGATVKLEIQRDGNRKTIKVKLTRFPEEEPVEEPEEEGWY